LFPWQTCYLVRSVFIGGAKWQGETLCFYFTDILLGALFLGAILIFWKKKKQELAEKKKFSFFHYPTPFLAKVIFAFLLWLSLTFFWAGDKEKAYFSLIFFWEAIGLFYLLSLVFRLKLVDKEKTFFWFLLAAVFQSLLGIGQFFLQKVPACKWLGISAQNPQNVGVSIVQTIYQRRWLRAYGGLPHPNILGGFLAVSALLAVGLYLYYAFQEDYSAKQLKKDLFLWVSFLLLLMGLFFTFSRSAWLGFWLGFLFLFFWGIKKKEYKKDFWRAAWVKLFFSGLAIWFILAGLFANLFQTRIFPHSRLEIKSFVQRQNYLEQDKKLWPHYWLKGAGIGNYGWADYKEIKKNYPGWYFQPVHNVFLLAGTELGVGGLILYLLLWLGIFFWFWQLAKNAPSFGALGLALLLALLPAALFDHWLWSFHFGIFLFWFIIGIGGNWFIKEAKEKEYGD